MDIFFPFCYYVEDEFHKKFCKSFLQVIAGKSYTHVYSGWNLLRMSPLRKEHLH